MKSCYKLLERQIDLVEKNWLCEMFCKTRASPKAVCFGWIAAKNACFTQDVLHKRLLFYAIDVSYVKTPQNLLVICLFSVDGVHKSMWGGMDNATQYEELVRMPATSES